MSKKAGKSIGAYRAKRDFDRTPEPAPSREDRAGAPVFVVHRHDARRLHYDLRLEMEGVLRSWAVPKGFSYDPSAKHLAVRTEDHPLAYERFHGVIPRGEYGAGTMTIWDSGRYEVLAAADGPSAVRSGELKLLLYGRKLRGEWHMVRTQGEEGSWLLFKSKDRYAGDARETVLGVDIDTAVERALPARLRRMEPVGERAPFFDPAWLFELEFTGRRVTVEKRGERVRLRGQRRLPPAVEAGLRELRAHDALLDGVLVAADEHGRPSRAALEAALAAGGTGVVLYLFDLLYFEDYDLRGLPLVDRKGALRTVVPAHPAVLFVDHVPGAGEGLAEVCAQAGLTACLAKRVDAPYVAGTAPTWVRVPVDPIDAHAAQGTVATVATALARRAQRSRRGRAELTNLAKVYWPAEGFTKGDLLDYYERVADVLLPHLRGRPMHLHRFPDGITGKCFYQKDAKEETPAWVATELVPSEHRGGEDIRYVVCDDRDTLLYLANLGSIDLHPWLSRRGTPDSPDWAVLDLDPKEAPFAHVVRLARAVGEVLVACGLRPLLKTSGKTGLHVYVPLEAGYTYAHSRAFCEGVARLVVTRHPEIATVERVIGSREGKVYLDFGQNRRGQTVVPPYSARPVRGASVSAPLRWVELEEGLSPRRFTLQTMGPRLAEQGDLFAAALTDKQSLLPAIDALQDLVRGGGGA